MLSETHHNTHKPNIRGTPTSPVQVHAIDPRKYSVLSISRATTEVMWPLHVTTPATSTVVSAIPSYAFVSLAVKYGPHTDSIANNPCASVGNVALTIYARSPL